MAKADRPMPFSAFEKKITPIHLFVKIFLLMSQLFAHPFGYPNINLKNPRLSQYTEIAKKYRKIPSLVVFLRFLADSNKTPLTRIKFVFFKDS